MFYPGLKIGGYKRSALATPPANPMNPPQRSRLRVLCAGWNPHVVLRPTWPPFPVVRPAECGHCSVIRFVVSTLCQMRTHNDA